MQYTPVVSFDLLHSFLNPIPESGDLFAGSADISGNNVLIGSFIGDDVETNGIIQQDVAYLFDIATGTLSQTFLNPTPPVRNSLADQFGFAVAIDRENALIGAPLNRDGTARGGAAYLFDTATGNLRQAFLNPASTEGDKFGHALAIDNDSVLVGAPFADLGAANSGGAYLFDGTTGELLQTFLNPTPEAGDLFGDTVAIDGDNVLVGAFLDDAGTRNSGAAHLFNALTGELVQTFVNPTPEIGDLFGRSVAVEGDKVLISAPFNRENQAQAQIPDKPLGETQVGAVYLFDIETGELLQTFFNPSSANAESFGISVALAGENVLIGASRDDSTGDNSGAAYLFDAATGQYLQTFLNPTPAEGDLFGNVVAMDGDNVLVGAIGDDNGGNNSGAAHLFRSSQPTSL